MFDWWTFFFQVVNFFIVLYILYRLFFNPLKRVIQKREEMIAERIRKLEEGEQRVEEDEAHYREKMTEIENLQEKELDEARKKALIETNLLMKEADREIEKAFEKEKRIIEEAEKKSEKEIRQKSLEFSLYYSEKLLSELSDELLHEKRTDQFLQALSESDAEEISLLKEELTGKACEMTLYTPFLPKENMKQKIKETIEGLLQCGTVILHSVQDSSLICGIRLVIENKVFDASVKGALDRFKEKMENEL